MWKDITSYSQGCKERIPTTYEDKAGLIRIVVTCGHRDYRPEWVMHCYQLNIDTKHLPNCSGLDEAKHRAKSMVLKVLKQMTHDAEQISA